MAECLQRTIQVMEKIKSDNEKKKMKCMEGEMEKIRGIMITIMEHSHKIVKQMASTLSIMVEIQENNQQGTLFMDLEAEKDKKEDSGPYESTRANLNRKADTMPLEIQDLNKVTQDMCALEAEVVETLTTLGQSLPFCAFFLLVFVMLSLAFLFDFVAFFTSELHVLIFCL